MQLVLCNNRVMTYGENFLEMGGVVINTETGAKYENATIAECDSAPSDIGQVGYEYKAGQFVPCAPFGTGDGNVPVLCGNDCKAIKDSGIAMSSVCLIEKIPYVGIGGGSVTLTFSYPPSLVFIHQKNDSGGAYRGTIFGAGGYFTASTTNGAGFIYGVSTTISGNTLTYTGLISSGTQICNEKNIEYEAIALCIKG